MSTVAGSDDNGHGKTKVAKAVATVAAYRESNGGRLPSRPELALLAGVSESTARDALALTRKD
jgi:DNA-binding FadR family transcriptional regulator